MYQVFRFVFPLYPLFYSRKESHMKKILLASALALFAVPALSQTQVVVEGPLELVEKSSESQTTAVLEDGVLTGTCVYMLIDGDRMSSCTDVKEIPGESVKLIQEMLRERGVLLKSPAPAEEVD